MNWRTGIVLTIAVASYAWAVFSPAELLTNDGPQHTFAAYVTGHIEEPAWSAVYRTESTRTSNGIHQLLVALEPLVGIDMAMRLVLLAALTLWGASWASWLRSRLGPASPLSALALAWAIQWPVFIGLWPFFLATAIIPAWLWLLAQRRWYTHVAAAAVLVGIAWVHISAAAMAGLLGVVVGALDTRQVAATMRVMLAGLPAGLYAVSATGEGLPERATDWLTIASDPVGFMFPAPAWQVVVVAAAAAWALVSRLSPGFTAAGLVGLLMATLLPLDIGAWQLVSPRLVPISFMLLLAGAGDLPPTFRRPAMVVALGLIVGRGCWAGEVWERAHLEVPPAVAFKDLKLPGQHWTLLILRSEVARPAHPVAGFQPSLHDAQAIAPAIGGAPYFSHHGLAGIHHILRTSAPRSPWLGPVSSLGWQQLTWDPELRPSHRSAFIQKKLAELAFIGAIVVYGYPADAEDAQASGFNVEVVWRGDDAVLFVARPGAFCTWEVWTPGMPTATAIVGFGDGGDPYVRDAAILGGTPWMVHAPCAPLWFVIDVPCAEADEDGLIVVGPGSPAVVRCTPVVTQ
jgi:hypothetical protein